MDGSGVVRLYKNKVVNYIFTRKFFVRATVILEKSSTLNGLRDGSLQDLKKTKLKLSDISLRILTHKKNRDRDD